RLHRDDRAAATLLQMWNARADDRVDPLEVHREDVVPELLRQILDRCNSRYARVAKDVVQTAEMLGRVIHHARRLAHRRDVAGDPMNAPMGRKLLDGGV